MSRPEKTDAILQKLLDAAPAAGLSEREVETLREVIAAFRGWKILERAAKWLMLVLTMLAGAAVAWDTLAARLRVWLQ